MKKLLILTVILFSGFVPLALAQGFVPLAPIEGLTKGAVANSEGLALFFNNLYKYMIGLAAALAVIMITWAGIKIAINKDNVSIITDSKGNIYNAIFGLVLVLSPVLVFSIINPSILNLSVNLPKLDTSPGERTQITTGTYTTLSDIGIQSNESNGMTVVFAYQISGTLYGHDLTNALNSLQATCTEATGGKGIVLQDITGNAGTTGGSGGGTPYMCKTCATGKTASLRPGGCSTNPPRICGSCN